MRPKLKIPTEAYSRECILDCIDDAHFEKNWKVKRRYQVILHAMSGRYTTDEIAKLVGCSRASVTNWVRRWRLDGPHAIEQDRYELKRLPALPDEVMTDLFEHLAYGLIYGPNKCEAIQVWLKERHDLDLSLTVVDHWYHVILDKLVYKRVWKKPKHPPADPYELDVYARIKEGDWERTKRRVGPRWPVPHNPSQASKAA